MADFVAVIRRAVDGLSDNTPELRAKVYEKARGAVLRQLESMKPRPPEEMLRRQLEKLENAIREVEAEHAEALPPLEEAEEAVVEAVPEAPLPGESAAPAEEAPHAAYGEPEVQPEPATAVVEDHRADAYPDEPAASAPQAVTEAGSVAAPAWDEAPAPVAVTPAAPEPAPEPWVAPAPVQPVSPPVAAAPAKPALWGDESWADEEEEQAPPPPAPAPVLAPVVEAPRFEPVAVEPEPVADVPAVAQPVEAGWHEPDPFQPAGDDFHAVPEAAALAPAEPETYPDFVVEDPTEKYAAMEPVVIAGAEVTEPVLAAAEWPEGGVDAGANARIGEEEWAVPAQYAAPVADDAPTMAEETGFTPPSADMPADPLAWTPETDLAPVAAAGTEPQPVAPIHADLAAPAQDYFDAPVLSAEAEEPVAPVAVAPSLATPVSLRPTVAAPKPEPMVDDEWDILGRELPQQKPQPAPARPADAWDESPFEDVPLPASGAGRSARESEQWDEFEDFDAFSPAPQGRAPADEDADDVLYSNNDKPARSYRIETRRRFDFTSIGIGLLGLVLVAGSGYGAWVFRDTLSGLVTGLVSSPPAENKPKTATGSGEAKAPEGQAAGTEKPAAGTTAPQETASAEPEIQKFTQRLKADGSEIDEGKADGGASGEGKSVAEQTVASAEPAATVPGAGTPATTTTPDATIPVGVSQKMYLYEERVGQTSPVAIEGAVVWSLKKETGTNGKTESIVEAQVSAPERNLSALITFKRNLDPSLPASHLVELVFSIPKEFEGGAIESVQRVALKQTEQDRGDPLIAVPAKITDDFHMIALNDYADARAFNLKLLETRDWIDIPVTYRNGRRALITMEKGSTGAEAFRAAIRDWNAEEGAAAPAPAPAQP